MSNEAIERLLDKLCGGDPVAAAEAFSACEPYLKVVVARWMSSPLRAKFDPGALMSLQEQGKHTAHTASYGAAWPLNRVAGQINARYTSRTPVASRS